MSLPDSAHLAALSEPVIKPCYFAWLDFADEPVRANSSGRDRVPTGTGDPDLDGLLFKGVKTNFVDVSPVKYGPGGSESVTVRVRGIAGLDDEMLAQIDERENWQGREIRLWRIVRNRDNLQQGGFFNTYTGRMVDLRHSGSVEAGEVITIKAESYLSMYSQASNLTYLSQEQYDPGDQSARAAIAIANGNYGGADVGGTGVGSGAGGGAGRYDGARGIRNVVSF